MSNNIEEIVKETLSIGKKGDFEKIVNSLKTKFEYDKTLFDKDIQYRNKTRYRLIENIKNTENDNDKLILLYSLRKFYREYKDIKDMGGLIVSIKDKTAIPEIIKYLDDEKQIQDFGNMIDTLDKTKVSQEEKQQLKGEFESEIQELQNKKEQEAIKEQDGKIITMLDYLKNEHYGNKTTEEIAELIKGLSNDNLKISAMETYFKERCNSLRSRLNDGNIYSSMSNELSGITNIINSMDEDINKRYILEEYLDESFKSHKELAEINNIGIKDNILKESYKAYKYNSILSLKDKQEELEKLQEEGNINEYLKYEKDVYKAQYNNINPQNIGKNIEKLNSDEEKWQELMKGDLEKAIIAHTEDINAILGLSNGISTLKSVVNSFEKDEVKLKAYEEVFKPFIKKNMERYKDNEEIKQFIEEHSKDSSLSIISSLQNKDLMIDKLIENEQIEEYLKYGYKAENKGNVIENNIDKILNYYNMYDIPSKKAMLMRMKESNSKVFEQMDYRLLEDKFLDTFSEHEINLIINQDRIGIDQFCNYNEKELGITKNIIRNLEKQDDFNEYFTEITRNLSSYKELVENLDPNTLNESQKQKLKNIIQYDNMFDIKTIDDIDNFKNIKDKKLQEIINTEVKEPKGHLVEGVTKSDVVETKKNALLIKMFGIDYETARNMVSEFGEQTDKDKDLKMMKNIVSLDHTYPKAYETDKVLREIFNDGRIEIKESLTSKIDYRKKYASKYEKMYNDVLFKPEDGKLIGEKDGIKIYDAGTDFAILTTSVAAYSGTSDRIGKETNEKEKWCRRDLSSNHFCGSFSRDDMVGMIPTELSVYYGFSQIKEGSLLYMSSEDNQSFSDSINSSINGKRPYRNPDNMILKTGNDDTLRKDLYNEFDIKREIDGKKTEPDYIIALKVGGNVINEKQALNSAKDWKKEKPIVVLDIDKCMEKGIENINESIKEYDLNPSNENLKKVWDNFHKTSITYGAFYKSKFAIVSKENFIDKVNLPKELKDNIANDDIKNYFYYLKDKSMFEQDISISQEENITEIKEMMNEMYGNKTKTELTFEDIGKTTLDSYKENPEKGIEIEEMLKNVPQMKENPNVEMSETR